MDAELATFYQTIKVTVGPMAFGSEFGTKLELLNCSASDQFSPKNDRAKGRCKLDPSASLPLLFI